MVICLKKYIELSLRCLFLLRYPSFTHTSIFFAPKAVQHIIILFKLLLNGFFFSYPTTSIHIIVEITINYFLTNFSIIIYLYNIIHIVNVKVKLYKIYKFSETILMMEKLAIQKYQNMLLRGKR